MSRINDLIAQLCPNGVEYKNLGSVGEFIRGNGLQKSDLTDAGTPAIHYGQIHTYYGTWAESTKSFTDPDLAAKLRRAQPGDLVIATTSEDDEAVAKATAWLGDGGVVVSGDAYIYRHRLNPKYVAYFFQSEQFQGQKMRGITGTKVRRISGGSLAKIKIPVPPLAIQDEVVSILDKMSCLQAELEKELEKELELRSRQRAQCRDSLLTFPDAGAVRWVPMGDVCIKVSSGATPLARRSEYYDDGTIPWLRTQEVVWHDIYETEMKITAKALAETAVKWIPANCVIVAISGPSAARAAVNKIPLTTNQHCCNMQIDEEQANYRYVFHWLSCNYEKLKSLGQGARSDLNSGLIKSFPIALPSLPEQQRIAGLLDKFDVLVSDLNLELPAEIDARRNQYEFYREKLLTFEEAVA